MACLCGSIFFTYQRIIFQAAYEVCRRQFRDEFFAEFAIGYQVGKHGRQIFQFSALLRCLAKDSVDRDFLLRLRRRKRHVGGPCTRADVECDGGRVGRSRSGSRGRGFKGIAD